MQGAQGWAGRILLPAVGLVVLSVARTASAQDVDASVHVTGYAGLAVRGAIQGAARRLANPTCRQILGQFQDAAGRTLQSNLEARGLSAEGYLLRLRFHDGRVHPRCGKSGIHAVTWPGSPVVYVCGAAFLTAHERSPFLAESYVIHEMLHTLGLGESPVDPRAPTSQEITDRVNAACRN